MLFIFSLSLNKPACFVLLKLLSCKDKMVKVINLFVLNLSFVTEYLLLTGRLNIIPQINIMLFLEFFEKLLNGTVHHLNPIHYNEYSYLVLSVSIFNKSLYILADPSQSSFEHWLILTVHANADGNLYTWTTGVWWFQQRN